MELIRLKNYPTQNENSPFKIFLTSTRHNTSTENLGDEIRSNIDSDINTYHTLGRGPLMQITDSRVSRKHAIVCYHIKENSWSITALRDCYYYQSSEKTNVNDIDLESVEWECLKKDCKIDLKSGYIISLLQNCEHAYQIFIKVNTSKDENTQTSSQIKLPLVEQSSFNKDKHDATLNDKEIKDNTGKYKDECKHKSENLPISILTSPPKTRQLPTWMSNADIPENNDSAVLRTCSSKGTGIKKENLPKSEVPWYERSFAVANNSRAAENAVHEPTNTSYETNAAIELPTQDTTSQDTSRLNTDVRPSCAFGSKCYRKNPQHKIDEAHPGDNDYTDANPNEMNRASDSVEPDDRPECEYGLQCYRKNPQHIKDYKHTSKTRASKRKASKEMKKLAKKAAGNHLSGESDEYESDFINDESDLDDEDISSDEEDVDEWKPEDED